MIKQPADCVRPEEAKEGKRGRTQEDSKGLITAYHRESNVRLSSQIPSLSEDDGRK